MKVTRTLLALADAVFACQFGMLLAPVYLFLLWRIRKDARELRMLVCLQLLFVFSLGFLAASGGGNSTSGPQSSLGVQTILVVATSGSVTKSSPLTLNLR